MIIAEFIKHDYTTIDAYDGVNRVRRSDSINKGIVVLEENKPIGVLTSADLAKKQHQIIIDCLSKKPVVKQTDKISDILNLMETSGNTVLMVYDDDLFVGTISQNDLLTHLYANLNRQKITLQSVAHDLQNPIASIKMLSDMLQNNLKLAENKQLVDFVNQSCSFAQKIIEDILVTEQSLEERSNFENEDFDELIEECVLGFSTELEEKQISLTKDLNFGQSVRLDRPKFKRAIHNLLSNSIKFTHRGGQINLLTNIHQGKLRFEIKDNGIGIPKKIQNEIFEKFTRAKRMGTAGEPTTGLGMYLTKQIVELHGGSIHVESNGQSGTSFLIVLSLT